MNDWNFCIYRKQTPRSVGRKKIKICPLEKQSPNTCSLYTQQWNFLLFPPGLAAGNSRAGGDGKQVLPCSAHSAPQILALQQEGDGSGSATPRSGGRNNNNRPGTKVSDSFHVIFIFLSNYYLSIWMALSQSNSSAGNRSFRWCSVQLIFLCGDNHLQGRCSPSAIALGTNTED